MSDTCVSTRNPKTLASFYTPPKVAQVLTDWAITGNNTTVLDPSFGGCAFLHAALDTLRKRGNPAPGRQIYGVDINPDAQQYLRRLLQAGGRPEQFVIDDFFRITPDFFGGKQFGAVVGNPPYIRYHDIPEVEKKRAVAHLSSFGIQISGRASHWAYFLLYSMQFLCRNGRMAMVLPGAFLHTDYAIQVRELLAQHFEEVTIYLLQERIFDGTDEESVLVCAAGAREPHRSLRIGTIGSMDGLERAFSDIVSSTRILDKPDGDGQWLRALIDPKTLELYDQLVQSQNVIRLGEWVESRIGVVTGNNDFFTLSRSEQERRSIPDEFLVPIIRRATQLRGLWITDDDLRVLEENGNKFLLLALEQVGSKLPKPLQDYIQHGEKAGVSQAYKCRSRQPWYIVPRTYVPPAFMPCMSAAWPRLVVNQYLLNNPGEPPGRTWRVSYLPFGQI